MLPRQLRKFCGVFSLFFRLAHFHSLGTANSDKLQKLSGVFGEEHRVIRQHEIERRRVRFARGQFFIRDIQKLDCHSVYVGHGIVAFPAVRKADPSGVALCLRKQANAIFRRNFVNLKSRLDDPVSLWVLTAQFDVKGMMELIHSRLDLLENYGLFSFSQGRH
ncbi:MAG: hypothetical protein NT069_01260 [Planctomycetota bacterium]|nr:hypothetical protein [Planctomycetota bacterium]